LRLYLDSSALVKRYVAEEGSDEVRVAMVAAERLTSCRLGFVETVRAVGLRAGYLGVKRVRDDWGGFAVIEIDRDVAERAAQVALSEGLRAGDALHLAAALAASAESLTFATWDARLHRAARTHGLRTLPAVLG
jgi:uncharacterized protein